MGSNLPGLASILNPQVSNPDRVAPIGKDHARGTHVEHIFTNGNLNHGATFQHSHSLPEPKLSQYSATMSSFGASSSNGSGIETLSGPQFLWGSPNLYPDKTKASAWRAPPSVGMGYPFTSNGQTQGFPYTSHHGSFTSSSQNHHQVGSAPPGVPFERHFGYYQESPEALYMSAAAFGGMGLNHNERNFMGARGAVNAGIAENGSPGFGMMSSSPRLSQMFLGNGHYPGLGNTSMDGLAERGRIRRVEPNGSQIDSKKQFQLDLDKILSGEDTRTTLMIKNIPNK